MGDAGTPKSNSASANPMNMIIILKAGNSQVLKTLGRRRKSLLVMTLLLRAGSPATTPMPQMAGSQTITFVKAGKKKDQTSKEARKESRKEKLRVTRRCMVERRRNRWKKRMCWEDGDRNRLIDIKEANPEDVQDFSVPMVLIGSDVAALYPNLDAEQVANIVYKAVLESKIKWENVDYLEATRYIALNWDETRCRTSSLVPPAVWPA